MLPVGARVPKGEVYGGNPAVFVRKVPKNDMDTGAQEKVSAACCAVAVAGR